MFNQSDEIKRSFFQAEVVSLLPYGCTKLTLTKNIKKKPDRNYIRMSYVVLNKS